MSEEFKAPRPHPMLRYQTEAPDFNDADALAAWIEQVRGVAFLSGARHEEITRSEVALLLPHILAFARQ